MKLSMLFALATAAIVTGCSSSSPEPTASNPTPGAQVVAMAKCGLCGKEVAKDELKSHDGTMACAECIASHGH